METTQFFQKQTIKHLQRNFHSIGIQSVNSKIERGAMRAVVCNDIIVEKRALMYVLTSFQLKASILYIMASQGK